MVQRSTGWIRLQFRLWHLLALVSIVGVVFGLITNEAHRRAAALDLLIARGATIEYCDGEGATPWQQIVSWVSRQPRVRPIKTIVLHRVHCDAGIADAVAILGEAEELRLVNCRSIRCVVRRISDLDRLQSLSLHGSDATNTDLALLEGHLHLQELSLEFTVIDNDAMPALATFPNLRRVYLHGTPLSDRGLPAITQCQTIECLLLGGDEFTDDGIQVLAKLNGLHVLHLYGNHHISDQGLARLRAALPRCEIAR